MRSRTSSRKSWCYHSVTPPSSPSTSGRTLRWVNDFCFFLSLEVVYPEEYKVNGTGHTRKGIFFGTTLVEMNSWRVIQAEMCNYGLEKCLLVVIPPTLPQNHKPAQLPRAQALKTDKAACRANVTINHGFYPTRRLKDLYCVHRIAATIFHVLGGWYTLPSDEDPYLDDDDWQFVWLSGSVHLSNATESDAGALLIWDASRTGGIPTTFYDAQLTWAV